MSEDTPITAEAIRRIVRQELERVETLRRDAKACRKRQARLARYDDRAALADMRSAS